MTSAFVPTLSGFTFQLGLREGRAVDSGKLLSSNLFFFAISTQAHTHTLWPSFFWKGD